MEVVSSGMAKKTGVPRENFYFVKQNDKLSHSLFCPTWNLNLGDEWCFDPKAHDFDHLVIEAHNIQWKSLYTMSDQGLKIGCDCPFTTRSVYRKSQKRLVTQQAWHVNISVTSPMAGDIAI